MLLACCPVPPVLSQAVRNLSHWARLSHVNESPNTYRPPLTCDDSLRFRSAPGGRFADLTQVGGTNGEVEPSHVSESHGTDQRLCAPG